jgi:hypothetical protein
MVKTLAPPLSSLPVSVACSLSLSQSYPVGTSISERARPGHRYLGLGQSLGLGSWGSAFLDLGPQVDPSFVLSFSSALPPFVSPIPHHSSIPPLFILPFSLLPPLPPARLPSVVSLLRAASCSFLAALLQF